MLNAVHAGISSADAVCVALGGLRSSDPDHQRSADLLEEIGSSSPENSKKARQLSMLLGETLVSSAAGAEDWSNWPIYAIGGALAIDEVVLYERLSDDLGRVLTHLGIEFDGNLPRAKAGLRRPADPAESLTINQIETICALFSREIAQFRYPVVGT